MNNTWVFDLAARTVANISSFPAQFYFSLGYFGSCNSKGPVPRLRHDAVNEMRSLH